MEILDWSDFAFKSKGKLSDLNAVFIVAPREISIKRFTQIFKEYITEGAVILGVSKEQYVKGFGYQPQFKMLQLKSLSGVIEKIESSPVGKNFYILEYMQDDLQFILRDVDFKKVILVNGSWKYTFHTRSEFYEIVKKKLDFEFISPFESEEVAIKEYERLKIDINKNFELTTKVNGLKSDKDVFEFLEAVSKSSFDNSFQVGAVLFSDKKELLAYSYNKVVPFETYALHYGNQREINMSPPNDVNFYSTNHAEVELIIECMSKKIDTNNSLLYINVLPCPSCARMICSTKIKKIIYKIDHSDGYAISLLSKAGKEVQQYLN